MAVTNIKGNNFQAFRATVKSKVPYLFPVKDAKNPLTNDEFKAWVTTQFGAGVEVEVLEVEEIDVNSLPKETIDTALARIEAGK